MSARLELYVIAFQLFICVHAAPGVVDKNEIKGAHPIQPTNKSETVESESTYVDYNAILSPRFYAYEDDYDLNDDKGVDYDVPKSNNPGVTVNVHQNKSREVKIHVEVTSKRNNIDNNAEAHGKTLSSISRIQLSDETVIDKEHKNSTFDHINKKGKSSVFNTNSKQNDAKKEEIQFGHVSRDCTDKTPDYSEKCSNPGNDDVKRNDKSIGNEIIGQIDQRLHATVADKVKFNNKTDTKWNNDGGKSSNKFSETTQYIHAKTASTIVRPGDQNNNKNYPGNTGIVHEVGNTNEDGVKHVTDTTNNEYEKSRHNPYNKVYDTTVKSANLKKGNNLLFVLPSFNDFSDGEEYIDVNVNYSSNESNERSYERKSSEVQKVQETGISNNKNSFEENKRLDQKSKYTSINKNQLPYWKIVGQQDKINNEDQDDSKYSENSYNENHNVTVVPLPYWIDTGNKNNSINRSTISEPVGNGKSCNNTYCFTKKGSYYYGHRINNEDRHYQHSNKDKGSNFQQKVTKYHTDKNDRKNYDKNDGLKAKTKRFFQNGIEKLKNLLVTKKEKNHRKSSSNEDRNRYSKHKYWHGKTDKMRRYYRRKIKNHKNYNYKGGRRYHTRHRTCYTCDTNNKSYQEDNRNEGNNNHWKNNETHGDDQNGRRDDNRHLNNNGNNHHWKQDGNYYNSKYKGDEKSYDNKRQYYYNDGDRHRNYQHNDKYGVNSNWRQKNYHANNRHVNHQYKNNDGNYLDWKNKDHYENDKRDRSDYHNNGGYNKAQARSDGRYYHSNQYVDRERW